MTVVTTMSISYKTKILFFLTSLLLLVGSSSWAAIGTVTEINGAPASLKRDKQQLEANKGTGLEMNDTISTAKTRLGLTFEDNTKVSITEQSKLVIDDFVYDPNTNAGKLGMRVALGTVRYASGAIAHNNRENVRLRTPTATISVRGTDFTMTVDDIGRSLVILLPTCPDPKKPDECWTGEISVETDAGAVILNQAFQATVVASRMSVPTKPKIIDLDGRKLDNLLIIDPPSQIPGGLAYVEQAAPTGFLDGDLLEFDELIKDLLAEDQLAFSELDTNRLDGDYLDNILDITNMLNEEMLDVDPVLPTVKSYPWIQYSYNEEEIFVRGERPPHIAEVKTERYTDGQLDIVQDGIPALIQLNNGGTDVVINITQTQ